MHIRKTAASILAAIVLLTSSAAPTQAWFARKVAKVAVGAAAADWAYVAGTAFVETNIALRSAQLGSTAVAGLGRLLAAHRILGPRAVYISLAKRVLEDPALFTRAVQVANIVGLESRLLDQRIQNLAETGAPDPDEDPEDECGHWGRRGGNDGFYDPHSVKDSLLRRFQLPDGSDGVISDTIPSLRNPNVKGAITSESGLVIKGVPFDVRGFPIFDHVAVVDLRIVDRARFANAGGPEAQLAMATRELRAIINGEKSYTGRVLELVQKGEVGFTGKFDARQLEAIMSGRQKIPGYTWHHHQDFTRMQLVPSKIHGSVAHVGGWKMNICRMLRGGGS